jgi:peptidoglycan-N-acetylglucosamine deacetylase
MVKTDRFPQGRKKAVTMSYDDGTAHDRKLVEIFNKYNIKGTFHLCSGWLGDERFITKDEVRSLYSGHEVSAHTAHHPTLTTAPREVVIREIMQDRQALEDLVGYPVRGMSYPNGAYNTGIMALLPLLGIEYARTVKATASFTLPDNFLEWHPTCHHKGDLKIQAEKFLKATDQALLYVWGHSYEFKDDKNWGLMEDFCAQISNCHEIWYATNIEIVDYLHAVRGLRFSASGDIIYNPSALPVWVSVDKTSCEVPPGKTIDVTKIKTK